MSERLIRSVREDLAQAMGLHAAPLEARVFRFERALPQPIVRRYDETAPRDLGGGAGPNGRSQG